MRVSRDDVAQTLRVAGYNQATLKNDRDWKHPAGTHIRFGTTGQYSSAWKMFVNS